MQYAVICLRCGIQELTTEDYQNQMAAPDKVWRCPQCGGAADWSDEAYEAYLLEERGEP